VTNTKYLQLTLHSPKETNKHKMVAAEVSPDSVTVAGGDAAAATKTQISRYSSLVREVITPGNSGEHPTAGMVVKVHYTGKIASTGEVFDSSVTRGRLFEFPLGQGRVIQGWDDGVIQMEKGEKCILRIPAAMGYGAAGSSPAIPPDADLDFEVELFDFHEKKKEKWELTEAEKIAEAKKAKETGNTAFKAGKMEEAREAYEESISFFDDVMQDWADSEAAKERDEIYVSANLNLAQVCIKTSDFNGGLKAASDALSMSSKNEKALYRQITCALALNELGQAKSQLSFWLKEVNSQSREARELHTKYTEKLAEKKKSDKNAFGGLFKKSLYTEKDEIPKPKGPRDVSKLPHVYFDVVQGEESLGRITFALYNDTVPKTAENFRQLCIGNYEGKSHLTYVNAPFHRVIPGFMMQGGDITMGNGMGGESIYGEKFADENLTEDMHTKRGLLSMANAGPNTNGSQFFVCFKDTPHLDGKHAVFGEVVDGWEVLDKVEGVELDEEKPKTKITISACGEIEKPTEDLKPEEEKPTCNGCCP